MNKPRKTKTLYHQNLRKRPLPFKETDKETLTNPKQEKLDSKTFWRLKVKQELRAARGLANMFSKATGELFDFIFGK